MFGCLLNTTTKKEKYLLKFHQYINMVFVSKLEISPTCETTGLFKVGKNQVESIDIDKEMKLIEIRYKKGSKWKYKLIQFRHVRRLVYNE